MENKSCISCIHYKENIHTDGDLDDELDVYISKCELYYIEEACGKSLENFWCCDYENEGDYNVSDS